MQRRDFLGVLGGAVAWPIAARAQQPAMPVIGFLSGRAPDEASTLVIAFHEGLAETGYRERRNVAIEYRWAEGRYDRLPMLSAELVTRQVDIIASVGGSVAAVKAATTTIPIVFAEGRDPVASGLVQSLNRPGGNLTGVSMLFELLGAKRLELLRAAVPNAKLIAILLNPNTPGSGPKSDAQQVTALANALGQRILVLNASSEREFEAAFTTMSEQSANALLVMADPFLDGQRSRLVALATKHAIPAIFDWREFVTIGGLMSYGINVADAYRQVGTYAGKILSGVKPAELPIVQVSKIELVLNLKTAKTLGLTFPVTLLGRADEVIE
jgi:putative ABC transport system substrate-binding protein